MTRNTDPNKFPQIQCSTNLLAHFFYPRIIKVWNIHPSAGSRLDGPTDISCTHMLYISPMFVQSYNSFVCPAGLSGVTQWELRTWLLLLIERATGDNLSIFYFARNKSVTCTQCKYATANIIVHSVPIGVRGRQSLKLEVSWIWFRLVQQYNDSGHTSLHVKTGW